MAPIFQEEIMKLIKVLLVISYFLFSIYPQAQSWPNKPVTLVASYSLEWSIIILEKNISLN